MIQEAVWDAVYVSAGVFVCLIIWSGIVNYVTGMRRRIRGK